MFVQSIVGLGVTPISFYR